MRKYKVLRLVNNCLEELASFDNEADAIDLADRAKYMAPFVYLDDGVSDLASLSVDGVFQHSIKILGASRSHYYS